MIKYQIFTWSHQCLSAQKIFVEWINYRWINPSSFLPVSLFCLFLTFNLLLISEFFFSHPKNISHKRKSLNPTSCSNFNPHVLLFFPLRIFLKEWWTDTVSMALLPSHSCVVCCRLALSYHSSEFSLVREAGFVLPQLRILLSMIPGPWILTLCLVSFAPASPDAILPFWPFPLLALHPLPCQYGCLHIPCLAPSVLTSVLLQSPPWLGSSLSSELPNLLLLHSRSMKINLVPGLLWASLPHVHTQIETTKPLQVMAFRHLVVIVPLLSHVWFFATPWTAARQASCPSLSPWVCSNSCPLSRWCHPTISSFVVPFSSHPQSFPASGSFLMSQLVASGGQSIRASASASVLPRNI